MNHAWTASMMGCMSGIKAQLTPAFHLRILLWSMKRINSSEMNLALLFLVHALYVTTSVCHFEILLFGASELFCLCLRRAHVQLLAFGCLKILRFSCLLIHAYVIRNLQDRTELRALIRWRNAAQPQLFEICFAVSGVSKMASTDNTSIKILLASFLLYRARKWKKSSEIWDFSIAVCTTPYPSLLARLKWDKITWFYWNILIIMYGSKLAPQCWWIIELLSCYRKFLDNVILDRKRLTNFENKYKTRLYLIYHGKAQSTQHLIKLFEEWCFLSWIGLSDMKVWWIKL